MNLYQTGINYEHGAPIKLYNENADDFREDKSAYEIFDIFLN